MRTFLIFTCIALSLCQLGHTQLVDPFGKVPTYEIKLTKLDDGAFTGAMEWKTGGIDSLQRFVIKGLSVKAPVMVRVISKAPKHNIDVSFHKSDWDKIETKVSTGKGKFVDKVFRTMNTAGIGISSKVAGIPYVVIVKVGLQFPSTKSLIRITDDIDEYNRHLNKMGIAEILPLASGEPGNNSAGPPLLNKNDDTLVYIIIALLGLIIILLAFFLIKKRKVHGTLSLFIALICASGTMAQNAPKLVPVDGQGDSPVFYEYGSSNVADQNTVPGNTAMNPQDAELISFRNDGTMSTRQVRINTGPGTKEVTGEAAAQVLRRIKKANEEFDREYRENAPGEPTEGGQRIPPPDHTREELQQLRTQVRQLQQQVALLSQEDRDYDEDQESDFDEGGILIYCEELHSCKDCHLELISKILKTDAYFKYLQDFYGSEIKDINKKIAHGNAHTQIHAALAIVWQRILYESITPAVTKLKKAYSDKFDDYLEDMIKNLEAMDTKCNPMNSTRGDFTSGLKKQSRQVIEHYRRAKIID